MPHYDRFRHHRRSIRLRNRDYRCPGAYYVTICAEGKGEIMGAIANGKVILNKTGGIVDACWKAIPEHFAGVRLDVWVVMPDHLHGILFLPHGVPDREHGAQNTALVAPGSLGSIVRSFKAAVSREVNRLAGDEGVSFWQRNYYERVLRNDEEIKARREYIAGNPLRVHQEA